MEEVTMDTDIIKSHLRTSESITITITKDWNGGNYYGHGHNKGQSTYELKY